MKTSIFAKLFILSAILAVILLGLFAHTGETARVFNRSEYPRLFKAGDVPTIYGVNFGCWLIIEGWCVPSVYQSINDGRVVDEWTLGQYQGNQPGDAGYNAASNHWTGFITNDDINKIAQNGITHVRIPVGYWMFYSREELDSYNEPYITGGQQAVLTDMIAQLKNVGIKVLIDLHGVPGSQNGQQHSGRQGDILFTSGDTVTRALDAVQRICNYVQQLESDSSTQGTVFGIELLNEPNPWNLPEGLTGLQNYYLAGYQVIRQALGNDYTVVIQDGYDFGAWGQFMANTTNAMMDTHMYQCFDDASIALTQTGHIVTTCARDKDRISANALLTFTGEWALNLATNEDDYFNAEWALAQMNAYETASSGAIGWFFWTLKTEYSGNWNYVDSIGSTLPSQVPASDSNSCDWWCNEDCCGPRPDADDQDIQNSVDWICSQSSDICNLFNNPDNHFYNPNQLRYHANIAYTQYWQTIAKPSGQSSDDGCNFGNTANYCDSNCGWVNQ